MTAAELHARRTRLANARRGGAPRWWIELLELFVSTAEAALRKSR